jgi:CRP-like cAMP-binding protein
MGSIEGYVRRYKLDALLSADLVEKLAPRRWEPGEFIIRSGDPVESLLFLVEGKAKAYNALENGQSVLASFFRPLDVFGEVELFSSEGYFLSVEARSPTLCLSLPVKSIKAAADRNACFFMYLCARLGEKIIDRNQAEAINLRYPVEARLASYLLALVDGGDILGTDDLGELADFLGASYRQLGRVVRRFREEGILERARGRISVLDRSKLEPLARDLYARRSGAVRPESFAR